ncbi:hypothetical protein IL306_009973 [Fusarium sp. DS 682]|nr:hypothetical protein IL306_009973 [Fusarium sp. DS 682]
MSANQDNNAPVVRFDNGGYHGVVQNGQAVMDYAMRCMNDTGAQSVVFRMWGDTPGADTATIQTFKIHRDGIVEVVSKADGPIPVPNNNYGSSGAEYFGRNNYLAEVIVPNAIRIMDARGTDFVEIKVWPRVSGAENHTILTLVINRAGHVRAIPGEPGPVLFNLPADSISHNN